MRYLSLCSGIEAASVAWDPLGWKAIAYAEMEAFPSAVLKHHYPDVPNLGDITKFAEWPDLGPVDLICGGTPCQSFSVAGLRKGLADPRGNLALTFLAIVDRYKPRYVVWENVPGVLSSGGGGDLAAFLGGLGQLGYGWAYRVLDAQYARVDGFPRAVPQRRRRLFVVGYLGDWRRAAAVLSEPESVLGNNAPRREAGQGVAANAHEGFGGGRTSGPIDASEDGTGRGTPLVPVAYRVAGDGAAYHEGDVTAPLTTGTDPSASVVAYSIMPQNSGKDYKAREVDVAQPLMAGGPVGGNQGGDYLLQPQAVAFDLNQITSKTNRSQPDPEVHHTLPATSLPPHLVQAVAFQERGREGGRSLEIGGDVAFALTAPSGGGRAQERNIATGWAVRRLTPKECERLMGFPDGWTDIPFRGKRAADGPRYKSLGNSMACNVVRWIGRRIQMVEGIADSILAEGQKSQAPSEKDHRRSTLENGGPRHAA